MSFFSLKSNIAKGIIGACAVGAISTGSISANFIDLTNIESVCKNVDQDALNKKLEKCKSYPSTSLMYEIYKEKITEEIEDLVNKNGAIKLKNSDIYKILEKYLGIGNFVAIKVEDEKGDKKLMCDPHNTDEKKYYCGKYKNLDAERLQKFFGFRIRRGNILDLDIIVDEISKKKGISFQKESITNEDIEEWVNSNIDKFTAKSGFVLHCEDQREGNEKSKAYTEGLRSGFDSGYTVGAITGIVSTVVGIVVMGATIWALSKLDVDGMENFRNMLNNSGSRISNIFNKAGNNVIHLFNKAKDKASGIFDLF